MTVGAHLEDRRESIAALEVFPGPEQSYQNMVAEVAVVLSERNPWGCGTWEMLVTSEEDRPVNRTIGFWRRHGRQLGVRPRAVEAWTADNGWIRRVAASPIEGCDQLVLSLDDPSRTRFRSVTVLPGADADISDLLAGALTISAEPGYQFLIDLAALAVARGSGVMVKDETQHHEPSLTFYGDHAHLAALRSALNPRR